MTTKDLLKLSTRIFTARKGRTALTVLGMGIGFGAILFLVSLGYGLQGALLQNITSTGALTTLDVAPNEQDGKFITSSAVDEMKKINGVQGVETSYNFNSRIKLGDTGSDARGEIASFGFLDLEGLKVTVGKPLDKNNSKEILVSSAIGKVFGKDPKDLVGQKISFSLLPSATTEVPAPRPNIEAGDYTIAGVTENEEAVFYAPTDGLNIPADIPFAKAKVECNSSNAMTSVKDTISQKGFAVSSLSDTVSQVNKLFSVVNVILGLFGIITLAVSAIGMFNTMTVALLERTTEIGIMRSIGASRKDILFMFIIESTLMGFCGGIAGIILGIASGQIVNLIVNIAAKYMGGKSLNLFAYPLWFLGFVLAFSIIIGFATGIGPAKRASSLDPLEALRSR
ncbi:MAG TPA: ABC transporter permease [Candidatus Saccharimonadales bacterium]|nr:ABC transporter permease [Candidatus Saccharimonadales bacterium]